MRRLALALAALAFVVLPVTPAVADGLCGVADGCSPCPMFEVHVSKRGVEITPVHC